MVKNKRIKCRMTQNEEANVDHKKICNEFYHEDKVGLWQHLCEGLGDFWTARKEMKGEKEREGGGEEREREEGGRVGGRGRKGEGERRDSEREKGGEREREGRERVEWEGGRGKERDRKREREGLMGRSAFDVLYGTTFTNPDHKKNRYSVYLSSNLDICASSVGVD